MLLEKGSCAVSPLATIQSLGWVSLVVDSRSCAHTSAAMKFGERRFVFILSFWDGRQVLLCKVVIPQMQKDSLDNVWP